MQLSIWPGAYVYLGIALQIDLRILVQKKLQCRFQIKYKKHQTLKVWGYGQIILTEAWIIFTNRIEYNKYVFNNKFNKDVINE